MHCYMSVKLICLDELHKVILEEQKVLKSQVPVICGSQVLYLANEETEHILFRPCRVSIR